MDNAVPAETESVLQLKILSVTNTHHNLTFIIYYMPNVAFTVPLSLFVHFHYSCFWYEEKDLI